MNWSNIGPEYGGMVVENDCTGLLETVEKQLDIYRELLSLAQAKKPVLVKGDIPELEKMTKEEELLILQVGRLEEQRRSLHQALANHFVLSSEELSLSELIRRTDGDTSQRFQLVFAEMTEVLKELADINQVNIELIKSSLDYIDFSMDILTSTNRAPVYNEQDDDKKQTAAKVFDRKI
ncbi:MAG: hypothetical protein CVV03_07705 [Firmicutes bacterium HGW-Firmicutes-8]|nr:MAG: hypothetical protein CVV03_07705 [Firmicutes bacterium HGW-Firmicutes-8]